MTDSKARPTIRKAPDTDRHPALAVEVQVDLHDSEAKVIKESSDETKTVKKSFWSRLFSRS